MLLWKECTLVNIDQPETALDYPIRQPHEIPHVHFFRSEELDYSLAVPRRRSEDQRSTRSPLLLILSVGDQVECPWRIGKVQVHQSGLMKQKLCRPRGGPGS